MRQGARRAHGLGVRRGRQEFCRNNAASDDGARYAVGRRGPDWDTNARGKPCTSSLETRFTDAGVASWYDFAVAIHDIGRKRGVLANDVSILPIATADYPTPARRPAYSVLDKVSTWAALGVPAAHWRAELEHMFLERENLNGG
jgi:hypothetical protein